MSDKENVSWIDLSAYDVRLVLQQSRTGSLYLCAIGGRGNQQVLPGLRAAGFHPNRRGDWVRRIQDGKVSASLNHFRRHTLRLLPEQRVARIPVSRIAPALTKSVGAKEAKRLSEDPPPPETTEDLDPLAQETADDLPLAERDDLEGDQRPVNLSDDPAPVEEDHDEDVDEHAQDEARQANGDATPLAPGEAPSEAAAPAPEGEPSGEDAPVATELLDSTTPDLPQVPRWVADYDDETLDVQAPLYDVRYIPTKAQNELIERTHAAWDALRAIDDTGTPSESLDDEQRRTLLGYSSRRHLLARDGGRAPENDVDLELYDQREFAPSEQRNSTPFAASYPVLRFVAHAFERTGIQEGARVFAPDAGAKLFAEFNKALDLKVSMTDPVAHRIHQILYPDVGAFNGDATKLPLPKGSLDAVAVIEPAELPITAQSNPEYLREHDLPALDNRGHMVLRHLDALRERGIGVVTTRAPLEGANYRDLRAHLLSQDLYPIQAVHVPDVNDIRVPAHYYIFQRVANGKADHLPPRDELDKWVESPAALPDNGWHHPRRAFQLAGDSRTHQSFAEGLIATMGEIPADIAVTNSEEISDEADSLPEEDTPVSEDRFEIPNGSYILNEEETLSIRIGQSDLPATGLNQRQEQLIAAVIPIRDAALDLLRGEVRTRESSEAIRDARRRLNDSYDAFVKRFGPLSQPRNLRAFEGDPSAPLMLGLEHYDAKNNTAKKADIFSKRTLGPPKEEIPPQTAEEAIAVCMARHGRILPDVVSSLMDEPWRNLRDDLRGKIYMDPVSAQWETRDAYLSGNIYRKLDRARAAAQVDDQFNENIEALNAVLPPPVPKEQIDVSLGAPYIPHHIHREFIEEVLGYTDGATGSSGTSLVHDPVNGSWRLLYPQKRENMSRGDAEARWATERLTTAELLPHAFNMSQAVVTDPNPEHPGTEEEPEPKRIPNHYETNQANRQVQALRDYFIQWVGADPDRLQEVADAYNEKMNGHVERKYDGSYLRLQGLAEGRELRPPQLAAAARIIEDGSALIAHDVGAGKTAIMATAAMEMRSMGLARKPMMVVPTNLLYQAPAEIKKFYPGARILMITNEDTKPANHQRFLAKVAHNDWDMVVVTKDTFLQLPMSPEEVDRQVERQRLEIKKGQQLIEANVSDIKSRSRMISSLKTREKALDTRAKQAHKRRETATKPPIYFDRSGVDVLFLDEAQYYKNLSLATRLNHVYGIGTSASGRAQAMSDALDFIRDKNGGERGAVLATATPISNTMSELYTMMRLAKPSVLSDAGINSFDQWVHHFARAQPSLEQDPAGQTWRYVSRLSEFVNVPEMVTLFRQVADIKTSAELGLQTPEVAHRTEICEMDAGQKAHKRALGIRALYGRTQKNKLDNPLLIGTDFRLGMIDLRLFSDQFPRNPNGRVARAATRIVEEYHRSKEVLGTQLVYSDFSAPAGHSQSTKRPKRFTVPEGLRDELIALGIPREEIAFVHDANNNDERARLFERFRNGELRVLIGSTEKLGVGSNIQDRIIALHNLDAPHRPTDLKQRLGRGKREGNMNEDIRAYTYTTEGYTKEYEALQIKAGFIAQAFASPREVSRSLQEEATMDWDEIIALTTDNPALKQKAEIDRQVAELEAEQSAWQRQKNAAALHVASIEHRLSCMYDKNDGVVGFHRELEILGETASDHDIYIEGEAKGSFTEAANAFFQTARRKIAKGEGVLDEGMTFYRIGQYRGLEIGLAHYRSMVPDGYVRFVSDDPNTRVITRYLDLGDNENGSMARIRNRADSLINYMEGVNADIERDREDLAANKATLEEMEGTGFVREAELSVLYEQQQAMDAMLQQNFNKEAMQQALADPELQTLMSLETHRGHRMLKPDLFGLAEPPPVHGPVFTQPGTELEHQVGELEEEEEEDLQRALGF